MLEGELIFQVEDERFTRHASDPSPLSVTCHAVRLTTPSRAIAHRRPQPSSTTFSRPAVGFTASSKAACAAATGNTSVM